MNTITRIFSKKSNTITINGRPFEGTDIKIVIDGKEINQIIDKRISIVVEGVVDYIETSNSPVTVRGDVGGSVNTSNAKVLVGGNINKGVNTSNGDVSAKTISGKVHTSNGNINGKRV